jgi:hypothetical protein
MWNLKRWVIQKQTSGLVSSFPAKVNLEYGVLRNHRKHLFFQPLAEIPQNFDRWSGAFEALTGARLKEYVAAVPNEWRSNNDAADRIAAYPLEAS